MKLLKIIGGIIIIFGASITLVSPFILLIGFGMLDLPPNTLSGIEISQLSGLIMAGVVFIVGAVIAIIGKSLWEKE